MRKALLLTSFILSFTVLVAQNTLKGIVKDSKTGQALYGASVRLKGAKSGTVTESKCDFRISIHETAVLEIIMIGFSTQEN